MLYINKRSCLFLLTYVFLQVLPAIVVGAWHWTAERQPLDRLQSPKTSKERKLSLIVYGGCLALVTCFFFVTQHSQWQPLWPRTREGREALHILHYNGPRWYRFINQSWQRTNFVHFSPLCWWKEEFINIQLSYAWWDVHVMVCGSPYDICMHQTDMFFVRKRAAGQTWWRPSCWPHAVWATVIWPWVSISWIRKRSLNRGTI